MATSDIYAFDDYRAFLQSRFERRKEERKHYTHRQFAADAGFSNPGYFNDVIKGRRKLSSSATAKIIKVFELSAQEAEFLRLLVEHSQSRDSEHKAQVYEEILYRRNRSAFTRLNPAMAKYYQDVRYPLVWGALEVIEFRGDCEELGRFLNPPLAPHLVRRYVKDLVEWGLVRVLADGRHEVTQKIIEPPPTLRELVRRMQREWIDMGREALAKYPPNKRHISSITLNISQDAHREIQKKIDSFRADVFGILEKDTGPDRLMQLNIQYFPQSRVRSPK